MARLEGKVNGGLRRYGEESEVLRIERRQGTKVVEDENIGARLIKRGVQARVSLDPDAELSRWSSYRQKIEGIG